MVGVPLVVHCWADLQLVHGLHNLRCYDNMVQMLNVSECLYSLMCLVGYCCCVACRRNFISSTACVYLQIKLGLVVDLTNTSRFYRHEDIAQHDCKYVKLQCRGWVQTAYWVFLLCTSVDVVFLNKCCRFQHTGDFFFSNLKNTFLQQVIVFCLVETKLQQRSRHKHLLTFVKLLSDVIHYMPLVGFHYGLTFAYWYRNKFISLNHGWHVPVPSCSELVMTYVCGAFSVPRYRIFLLMKCLLNVLHI